MLVSVVIGDDVESARMPVIRERLKAWKAAGEKGHVHTMQIGTGQPEALELLAEELL
jgi:hypothetical protein